MDTENPNTDDQTGNPPPAKRLRIQDPDVVVVVGKDATEFPCYKVVLSYASEYFDTMLASGMKESEESRIAFPDKDPEEWKLFYSFINPETAGAAKITSDNVEVLIPWFHEFQMKTMLDECDKVLATYLRSIKYNTQPPPIGAKRSPVVSHKEANRRIFQTFASSLASSDLYNLPNTRRVAFRKLAELLSLFPDLFDLDLISKMVPLLKKEAVAKSRIWGSVKFLLLPETRRDTNVEALFANGGDIISHLFYAGVEMRRRNARQKRKISELEDEMRRTESKLQAKLKKTEALVKQALHFPDELHDRLLDSEFASTDTMELINEYSRFTLKDVIFSAWKDKLPKNFEPASWFQKWLNARTP